MNWIKKLCWRPTHKHYKGGYYKVLNLATMEATLQDLVIYQGEDGKIWVRTAHNFNEYIESSKQSRFIKLK